MKYISYPFLLYRKIKWFLFLPYISLLIMGIAQAGRAGFILILVQVFLSSFWITVYDQKLNYKGNNNFFAEKKRFFWAFFFMISQSVKKKNLKKKLSEDELRKREEVGN